MKSNIQHLVINNIHSTLTFFKTLIYICGWLLHNVLHFTAFTEIAAAVFHQQQHIHL